MKSNTSNSSQPDACPVLAACLKRPYQTHGHTTCPESHSLQTLAEARRTRGFMKVLMSSSQHHTLPGHSQPRDRTINPISQMRGVMHREVDYFTVKSPIQIPTTLVPRPFPNPYEQPRLFTMCCSHTTTCGDGDGGAHCSPSFSSVYWQLNVLFLFPVQRQFHASHCVAYLLQLALSSISDRREGLSCP